MVATQDIKAGQLILAEKAFSLNDKRQDMNFEIEQALIYLTNPENVPMLRNT